MKQLRGRARRWGRPLAARGCRGAEGATIVEVIVAIFVLAVIVTPAARLVIQTGAAGNEDRVRVEATNLATQVLENELNNSYFGVIQPGDTYTPNVKVTENGGTRVELFNVTVSYRVVTATNQSVCASNGGTIPSQIYVATAKVDWKGDGGSPVLQTTLIAPEQAGALPAGAGEIAVPVDTSAMSGAPYTATSVPVTVVGVWTGGGSAPPVPAGEVTYGAGNTGTTGCAVFPNLDPRAGWVYDVYLGAGNGAGATPSNQSAVITDQEYPGVVDGGVDTVPLGTPGGALSGAEEEVTSLTVGSAVVAPAFYVDPGASVGVSFSTVGFPSITPAADLPVTVQANPQLQGPNSAFAYDTAAAPQAITGMTVFPYTDYFVWSGDTVDAYPADGGFYPTASPASLDATQPGPLSVSVPVYAAVFKDVSAPAGVSLTVTNVSAPNETFTLNPFASGTSSTGIPLGEYVLGATGGHTVATPKYIWVTDTAVYSGPSAAGSPSAMPLKTASGTAITVAIT